MFQFAVEHPFERFRAYALSVRCYVARPDNSADDFFGNFKIFCSAFVGCKRAVFRQNSRRLIVACVNLAARNFKRNPVPVPIGKACFGSKRMLAVKLPIEFFLRNPVRTRFKPAGPLHRYFIGFYFKGLRCAYKFVIAVIGNSRRRVFAFRRLSANNKNVYSAYIRRCRRGVRHAVVHPIERAVAVAAPGYIHVLFIHGKRTFACACGKGIVAV